MSRILLAPGDQLRTRRHVVDMQLPQSDPKAGLPYQGWLEHLQCCSTSASSYLDLCCSSTQVVMIWNMQVNGINQSKPLVHQGCLLRVLHRHSGA
jgi:hypothetical protein